VSSSPEVFERHAIQAMQRTIDPIDNPGQNGEATQINLGRERLLRRGNFLFLADRLGIGSVQDSQKADYEGNDEPFWDSVTANIKNLRAIVSGHG
jgi:hypothetical protein